MITSNYLNKIILYLKAERYYPLYVLMAASIVLFSRLHGSIEVWDEAIYSQISKENFLRQEWLTLYYHNIPWFEKPPFVIWLTMLSFQIFGINEFALWFFPALMGVATAMGLYFLGKELFNARVGLMASLILLSTPHFILTSRYNTMDIFLAGFSLLSMLFLVRSFKREKNLMGCFLFLALAFMSKSVVALLMIPVFLVYIYMKNGWHILQSRYFRLGMILFFLIVLPWHLYMIYVYRLNFLGDYLGYHVFARYSNDILGVGHSRDIFFYPRLLLRKMGSWWFVFLALLPIIYSCTKKAMPKEKETKILSFWAFFILAIFSFSSTKLEQYIIPFYPPFTILLAAGIYRAHRTRNVLLPALASLAFLINLSSYASANAAYSGEAQLSLARILLDVLGDYDSLLALAAFIYLATVFLFAKNRKHISSDIALIVIFASSFLFPLHPNRNILAKKIGEESAREQSIEKIYIADYFRRYNFDVALSYYIFPTETEYIKGRPYRKTEKGTIYCLIDLPGYDRYGNIVYEFFPCEIER